MFVWEFIFERKVFDITGRVSYQYFFEGVLFFQWHLPKTKFICDDIDDLKGCFFGTAVLKKVFEVSLICAKKGALK